VKTVRILGPFAKGIGFHTSTPTVSLSWRRTLM
jgi:hypothetical protein